MLQPLETDHAHSTLADDPGRYPSGEAGRARDWDGHAWAASAVSEPTAPALGLDLDEGGLVWRRRRRAGVVLAVVAVLVGAAIAAAATATRRSSVLHTGGLVLAAVLAVGTVLLVLSIATVGRLRMGDALHRNGLSKVKIGVLGLVCGLVAIGLALVIEKFCHHSLGVRTSLLLFLAGPIEESAKLALPLILFLIWRRRRRSTWLADPRIGLLLVWLSGTVFGVAEGIEYIVGLGPKAGTQHLAGPTSHVFVAIVMTCLRSVVEMMHPLFIGGAAAVIWLTVWRGRRLLNSRAIGAFLIAVALHSLNDGVIAGVVGSRVPAVAQVGLVAVIVVGFLVFRRHARELMPPSQLPNNPPKWRPRNDSPLSVPDPVEPSDRPAPAV